MESVPRAEPGASQSAIDEPIETAADAERDLTDRKLAEAVSGLLVRTPAFSAASGLWPWQGRALAAAFIALLAGFVLLPETALVVLLTLMAFPFLCVVALRTVALWQFQFPPAAAPEKAVSDPNEFPIYTVLVPLFREAKVVRQLLAALRELDYPRERLEIMLIAEEVDRETREALHNAIVDPHMRVLVVPDGAPRTKPRAIQYGLQFAVGEYVVVYDAEDAPEPDQLRRALAALKAGGPHLGCLQAQLNIYNSDASWFTRGIMAQTPQRLCYQGASLKIQGSANGPKNGVARASLRRRIGCGIRRPGTACKQDGSVSNSRWNALSVFRDAPQSHRASLPLSRSIAVPRRAGNDQPNDHLDGAKRQVRGDETAKCKRWIRGRPKGRRQWLGRHQGKAAPLSRHQTKTPSPPQLEGHPVRHLSHIRWCAI